MNAPTGSFLSELRSLPRPVWVLATGTFADRFGTFVVPFLVLFLTARGLSKEMAGAAAGLFGVGVIGAAVLGGYLSDRIGRRKTIAVSMFGGATAAVALYLAASRLDGSVSGLSWDSAWVLLCSCVYGGVRGMYHSAASSLVADLVPAGARVAAFAAVRFAINLGWASGMAIAGFLAEHAFGWLFAIDAAASCVFGAIALGFLPAGVRSSRRESGWGLALASIRRNRRFLLVAANGLLVALIYTQWHSSYTVFLRESGYPARVFGLMMALNGVLIILFEMPVSAWARRFAPTGMIAFGTVLAGVGFGMNGLSSGLLGLVVAMIVFTFGEMIIMPVQGAYVANLAPRRMRGRYNGSFGFLWGGANVVGPLLGLSLLGYGPAVLCWTVVGIGLAGAAFLLGGGTWRVSVRGMGSSGASKPGSAAAPPG